MFLSRLDPNKTTRNFIQYLSAVFFTLFAGTMVLLPSDCLAQTSATGSSGLPVPRFVSLKSKNVNMRIGPGKQFQVAWKYVKKGLPIEIIQEYENWRKVRDPEGDEGWILHSLLSGKRTVIINPGELKKASGIVPMFDTASRESTLVARLEPGVVAQVLSCLEEWCRVSAGELSGHIEKKKLWGVYPDELIEE